MPATSEKTKTETAALLQQKKKRKEAREKAVVKEAPKLKALTKVATKVAPSSEPTKRNNLFGIFVAPERKVAAKAPLPSSSASSASSSADQGTKKSSPFGGLFSKTVRRTNF